MAQEPSVIRSGVAVMDPNNSTNAIPNTLKVNADGSINTSATGTFAAGATATAASPSYVEGTSNPLSQTLTGNLRTVAVGAGTAGTANAGVVTVQGIASMTPILTTSTPVSSGTMTTSQVTVPATANGIVVLASNASRKGATISNPSAVTVYISSAPTGLTTSNGFGIPAGSSYNIDEPLYTGAIYGIISTSTQVVTVVELT